MNIYRRFAEIYAYGPYPGYSLTALDLLPAVFEKYSIPSAGRLLDLACGEGSFSTAMAKDGWLVTGIDQSPDMIELAEKQADQNNVAVEYIVQDMRQPFPVQDFDLVTCWYDSLNYLLASEDLLQVFQNVHSALKPNAIFLFDMNTIYGLAVGWQRHQCYIQQNASEVFEVHRTAYDYERQIASVQITAFLQQGDLWERVDEQHQERGYRLEEIHNCLTAAGFEILATLGSLRELTPPKEDSNRVWIVARRPA
jgi:2-polyprenyl-3-methyl-5-hydroxy-6-metoxy-1,4-benzoquinol methylase